MRAADRLADDFPHGTIDGYRAGCRTSTCPALLPCRDVYRRYQGDYGFRRLVDQGVTLEEILRRDAAEREGIEKRDRAANRTGRALSPKDAAPAAPALTPAASAPPKPTPAAPPPIEDWQRDAIAWREKRTTLYATLRRAEQAVTAALEARDRAEVAFDAHIAAGEPTAPVAAAAGNGRRRRRDEIEAGVHRLHADGKDDGQIGAALKITRAYAGMVRRDLGLTSHIRPGSRRPKGAS
ncbi:MAG: hypothetical protein BGO45_04780 [Microbacterium sp. 71-36]|uniref:hypothetical protein n=1 Tax=unclassified Microbacterium TaxID=2609290 RepID=UPI00086B6117|nr:MULTISPECIES: hypothetical protein [unclassified Microbacterium]MBN9212951.1 hypothetical protein [Microbacterium sp.]ODT43187.1 MAG: hypothetical protein ABS60_00090 [Microbacterium sp. SCN 71-17]OJV75814.1 MAG: hypothetical protein BGO45_04780 [Microbacterium sp. 71-36]